MGTFFYKTMKVYCRPTGFTSKHISMGEDKILIDAVEYIGFVVE